MSANVAVAAGPLDVTTMPLTGRHLIEASAGTGKTFNITRLYLRLLLEKQLTVQQILVMTFTNAATEEIRGRIAETLREAAILWRAGAAQGQMPETADPVFRALYAEFNEPVHQSIIEAALLELDEAAVFTIHGFCNRILSELAFTSAAAMQLSLSTDTRALYLQAAQDWIRQQAKDAEAYEQLMRQGWHTPETLLNTFESAIRSGLTPHFLSPEQIQNQAQESQQHYNQQLQSDFEALDTELAPYIGDIETKLVAEVKDAAVRHAQWQDILEWLAAREAKPLPADFNKFAHHSRFKSCPELKPVFARVRDFANTIKKVLAEQQKQQDSMLEQAPAMAIIAQGFDFIRQHVARQKRQQGVVDFDDLIALLADQVDAPDTPLATQLRQKYPAALIDEFQDTDASQYQILSNIYQPRCDQVLLMIGDPKQAIYGFRGGDIFTYLEAGQSADHRWVMDTNWRSTAPMVASYNRLFYGAPLIGAAADVFGFGIAYEPVKATEHAKANKALLHDDEPGRAALTYACVDTEALGDKPAKGQLQQQLARWMADEIVRLLNSARLGENALQPQDIAILVRSGPEAAVVQNALRRVGLASVFLSNRTNLFASHEAQDLYRVLDGIWHYQQSHRLSAALSSPLFGLTHAQLTNLLYHEDDNAWEAMMEEVLLLRQMWEQRGCMTLILYLLEEHFASFEDSMERRLTNYLHLAEVLERESAVQEHAQQLLIWLHRQISEPQLAQEQIQRLESDAQLIQVVTQHGSKGLEYPIVFVPFASDYRDPAKAGKQFQAIYRYYDEQTAGLRLMLGRSDSAIERVRREGNAESTRLLYVAVTRAAQRCYLGVAPFEKHQQSALAQALGLDETEDWQQTIHQVVAEGGAHTACALVPGNIPVRALHLHETPEQTLSVDTFDGEVTERWRLYSFSALARRQMVVNRTRREAELDNARMLAADKEESDTADQPFRFRFTKGAAAGNLLHDILEHCDFTDPDWQGGAMDMAHRFGVEEDQLPAFFEWLDDVLATPLNEEGLTLASLPQAATLREAEFYFPLNTVNLFQLNQFLAGYRQQDAGQGPFMVNLDTKKLEGLMHGFIDLIFEFEGRYYVADYKSTHLGDSYAGYQQAQLTQNNQHHLYDLQYLIYAVALHRYLQTKLPGYHPSSHFGGVYYLYLRGMHPDNQELEGVYHARPSEEQLFALDAIFKHAEAS